MKKSLALRVLNLLRVLSYHINNAIDGLAQRIAESEVQSRGFKLNRSYRLQSKIRASLIADGVIPSLPAAQPETPADPEQTAPQP